LAYILSMFIGISKTALTCSVIVKFEMR